MSNAHAVTNAIPSIPQASPRSDAEEANVPAIPKAPPTASPTEAITLSDLSFIVPPSHSPSRVSTTNRTQGQHTACEQRAILARPKIQESLAVRVARPN